MRLILQTFPFVKEYYTVMPLYIHVHVHVYMSASLRNARVLDNIIDISCVYLAWDIYRLC